MLNLGSSVQSFIDRQDLTAPLSTAQGVGNVPFQRWFKFKEAFSPKFVFDVIGKSQIDVKSIFDPFGGSGTTSLTAQMAGISPSTIEVNPFLADLIESKLQSYDSDGLIEDWLQVLRTVNEQNPSLEKVYAEAPKTLYQNEDNERWIFERDVLFRICQYRQSIDSLNCTKNKRLLNVLLGSILISVSNVFVNGKGRRYRKNWESNKKSALDVDNLLSERINDAIFDIVKYANRGTFDFKMLRGDSRALINKIDSSDLVLFSPPYPNTFDYTDIYNVELWALGYLTNSESNRNLRTQTLRSHVQVKTQTYDRPESITLEKTLKQLNLVKNDLWNKNIPDMVSDYFKDIETILSGSKRVVTDGGLIVIVIGDSRYSNIRIDTAAITTELANRMGLKLVETEKIRVMKSSAQQGWSKELDEVALYYTKK